MKFAEWLKAYIALAGTILTALAGTTGILPDAAKPWVSLALVIVTAVTTWAVPNKDAVPPAPSDFDFDPPAPAWKSAGPAWDEPTGDDLEPPKSLPYLVPPLPSNGNWALPASHYLTRAEENEVRVA